MPLDGHTGIDIDSLGPQRAADPPLLRRIRLHQSWYRSEALHLDTWGTTQTPPHRGLGSILSPQDADAGFNFVDSDAAAAFADRRAAGWGLDPYRCLHYMTSSQVLTLNIFGPLRADPAWARRVLVMLGIAAKTVDGTEIEFAPQARVGLFGDRTIADALVHYVDADDRLHSLAVETKLADRFSQRVMNVASNERYLDFNRSRSLWDVEAADFGSRRTDQLARVHALGLAFGGADAPATLLVLHHSLDESTPVSAEAYRRTLLDPARLLVRSLDVVLDAMHASAASPAQFRSARRLVRRYVHLAPSEEFWAASEGARRGARA